MKADTKTTSAPARSDPEFRPQDWYEPMHVGAAIPGSIALPQIGLVLDLTAGARLVLQILEREGVEDGKRDDDSESEATGRPLFSGVDRAQLLRFAIAAVTVASDTADDLLEYARESAERSPTSA